MSNDSKNEFIASIKKSGVIEPKRFKEWLGLSQGETPKEIAKELIRDQLLTKWQAKYLMSGRSRLDIGSYRLLNRTSRDELGDRFMAMHTSLARKVDLQVLPLEVTKNEKRCKAFLKKASLVGNLDHRNLIHVYDIDQEGGRYLLVTEFVEAISLDQLPRTKLKAPAVAQMMSEAFSGIQFAHSNNVVHGGLTQSDLLSVTDECLKIQNLAVSPLRSDDEPKPSHDLQALRKIGIDLLKQIPESNRCKDYKRIGKLFVDFKSEKPEGVEKLIEDLSQWSDVKEVPDTEGLDEFNLETGAEQGGFDQPVASTSLARKKKNKTAEEPDEEEFVEPQKGYVARLWSENPVAVIATSMVMGLMFFGGTGYAVYSSMIGDSTAQTGPAQPGTTKTSVNSGNRKSSKAKKPDGPPTESDIDAALSKYGKKSKPEPKAPKNRNNPNRNPKPKLDNLPDSTKYTEPRLVKEWEIGPGDDRKKIPAETLVSIIGKQSKEGWVKVVAQLEDGSQAEGEINSNLIYDAAAKGEPPTDKTTVAMVPKNPDNPAPAVDPNASAEAPKPEPKKFDLAEDISGIGDKYKEFLIAGGLKTIEQLAKSSTTDVKAAMIKGGQPTANNLKTYGGWIRQAKTLLNDDSPIKPPTVAAKTPANGKKPANAKPSPEGPFAGFPRITNLPKTSDLKEKRIGGLVINNTYLLGLEILADRGGVSKTKLIYELTRSSDDKQKWSVGVKKRVREKPTPIGEFRKSADAFFFKWLPEAADNKYSEFLRNCHLKLKLPDDKATYLTLRRPIKIHDLRLTANQLSNSLEVTIPAMPNPENILVEVLPFRVPGLELETIVSVVERNSPARIMLKRRDPKGFMWIQIDGELRSSLKIRANVVGRLGTNFVPMRNADGLNNFIGTFRRIEQQANRANNIKQQQQHKDGQKTKLDEEKKKYQSAAKQAAETTNKVLQYADIVSKLLDKPIAIRVSAKFGTLQTQLVATDPKLPQTDPNSKKKKKKK